MGNPISDEQLESLIDFIKAKITADDGLRPSYRLSVKFLDDNAINKDDVLEWLCNKNCFSDYEVLYVLKQRLADTFATDNELLSL